MVWTIEQIAELLRQHRDDTGVDFRYRVWNTEPAGDQFIAYIEMAELSVAADNINYFDFAEFAVELYSKRLRSLTAERQLESRLKQAGIFYRKNPPEWISDEEVYVTTYYI